MAGHIRTMFAVPSNLSNYICRLAWGSEPSTGVPISWLRKGVFVDQQAMRRSSVDIRCHQWEASAAQPRPGAGAGADVTSGKQVQPNLVPELVQVPMLSSPRHVESSHAGASTPVGHELDAVAVAVSSKSLAGRVLIAAMAFW